MTHSLQRRTALLLLVLLVLLTPTHGMFNYRRESERGELLRSGSLRCGVCRAVVKELLWEVHKHQIIGNEGEEAVLDSVKACCIPVLQNYTLKRKNNVKDVVLVLNKRGPDGVKPDENAVDPVAARLLKEMCFDITEEHDMVLAEQMYARAMVTGVDATALAKALCGPESSGGVGVCGASTKAARKAAKRAAKAAKRAAKAKAKLQKKAAKRKRKQGKSKQEEFGDQFADYFQKMNLDGSMTAMLQREREHPDSALPDAVRATIRHARELPQVRCAVCGAAVAEFIEEARSRRALADEIALVEGGDAARICFGAATSRAQEMEMMSGIPAPDTPPKWASRFTLLGGDAGFEGDATVAATAAQASEWTLFERSAAELAAERSEAAAAVAAVKEKEKETRRRKRRRKKKNKKRRKSRRKGEWDEEEQPDLEELREIMMPTKPKQPSAAELQALARTGHVVMGACRNVVAERVDELAEAVYSAARKLPAECRGWMRSEAEDTTGVCTSLIPAVASRFCASVPNACSAGMGMKDEL